MSYLSSIARPYALAAFETARDTQQLPAWSDFLKSASLVAADPAIVKLLGNPQIVPEKLFNLFQEVLAVQLDPERINFLRLLAQNHRLHVLPNIAESFNAYYEMLQKISKVRIVTAIKAEDEFKKKITQALIKRIQHDVTLNCEIDPAIIGGAIIHMGDQVIDGSIRGKLSRLLNTLTG